KAIELCRATRRLTLADDSGIEVDSLGGTPGVRSARYAGEHATDEENNQKLLRELSTVPWELRTARFRCVLALAEPGAATRPGTGTFGVCEGRLALATRGPSGFGYDPLFVAEGDTLTFAELDAVEKNLRRYRSVAARAMAPLLKNIASKLLSRR